MKIKSQQELFEMWQVMMFGKVVTAQMELDEIGPVGNGYEMNDARVKFIKDGVEVKQEKVLLKDAAY